RAHVDPPAGRRDREAGGDRTRSTRVPAKREALWKRTTALPANGVSTLALGTRTPCRHRPATRRRGPALPATPRSRARRDRPRTRSELPATDRKSTRLNSSHDQI